MSCNAGNEDCLADTLGLGELDVSGTRQIPRGLEHPVLCNYFKQKTILNEWVSVFDRMDKLQQNVDYTLKTNYINALACTHDESILYEFLELSLQISRANFTQSDRRNLFYAVLENEKGLEAVIRLLNTHAASNAPTDRYGWSWQRILLNMADSIHTEAKRSVFLEFLDNFEHDEVTRDHLDRARVASNYNLEAQKEAHNVRQVQLITEILDRVFGVTTTTTANPSSTTPSTTTPDSGTSLKFSSILFGLILIDFFFN